MKIKKLLLAAVCIVSAVLMLTIAASAAVATVDGTEYDDLSSAISAAKTSGSAVELVGDASIATLPGGTYTIDGNDYTITLTASASDMWGANDITVKNATISAGGADLKVIVPGNTTKVTFDNVTFADFAYGHNFTKTYTEAGATLTLIDTTIDSVVCDSNPFNVVLEGTASIGLYRPTSATTTTFGSDFAGKVLIDADPATIVGQVEDGANLKNVTCSWLSGQYGYNNEGALGFKEYYAAQIKGWSSYASIDAAFADLANASAYGHDTITLLDNVTLSKLPGGSYVIDGQGLYTITLTESAGDMWGANDITLKDVTVSAAGADLQVIRPGNTTDVTFENVTFADFAYGVNFTKAWTEAGASLTLINTEVASVTTNSEAFAVVLKGESSIGTYNVGSGTTTTLASDFAGSVKYNVTEDLATAVVEDGAVLTGVTNANLPNYKAVNVDGALAWEDATHYVAQIPGWSSYTTIDAAFADLANAAGYGHNTIELLDNVTLAKLPAGSYTVEGNGMTITLTETASIMWGANNITVKNAVVSAAGADLMVIVPGDTTKVTFENVTFDDFLYGVNMTKGWSTEGAALTLINTDVDSVVADGNPFAVNLYGTSSINNYQPTDVTVTTFGADFAGSVKYTVAEELATGIVEDGADLTNVTLTTVANRAAEAVDGALTWKDTTHYVASIPGWSSYTTIDAAFADLANAAGYGYNTIKLLEDATIATLPEGSYVIDGNDNTITLTASASEMWGANDITVKNATISAAGADLRVIVPGNTTKVTFENVTFDDFAYGVNFAKAWTEAGASLTLINTDVTSVTTNAEAFAVVLKGTSSIGTYNVGSGTTTTLASDFTGSVLYNVTEDLATAVVEDGADLTNVTNANLPNYKAVNVDGALAWEDATHYVAKIQGWSSYTTIEAALADLANATANGYDTLTLLEDATIATLPAGSYVIDGNFFTITITTSASDMWGANNITVKNAVISAGGADLQVIRPGNTTKVTFENVNFADFAYGYNFTKAYTDAGASLTLINTNITSVTTNAEAFAVVLKGTSSIGTYNVGSGTTTTLASDFAGSVLYNVTEDLATAVVEDGADLTNVTNSNLAGYKAVNNNGALAWEDSKTYVAMIGSTKYETIDAALADKANGTIVLLADVAVNSIPSNVSIDGAGYTITVANAAEVYGTTITLSDVTIASNGASYALGMGYTTLNLVDVTFTGFALDVYAIWGEDTNVINITSGNLPNVQFKGGANYAFEVNASGDATLGTVRPTSDDVINVSGQVSGVVASATVDNLYVAADFDGAIQVVCDAPASGVVVGKTDATSFANTGIVKSADKKFIIVPMNGELVLVEGAYIINDAGYYDDGTGVIRFMVTYGAELTALINNGGSQYGLYAASADLSDTTENAVFNETIEDGYGIVVDVVDIPADALTTEIIPVAFAKIAGIDEMVYFFGDAVSVTTSGNKYLGAK